MLSLWWRSARCGYLTAFIVTRNITLVASFLKK
jgi:hypothetical protein